MKIISAQQIRQLDQATIQEEPISSVGLMERASQAFVNQLLKSYPESKKVMVICGIGNNGGDGLAIARLLRSQGCEVVCCLLGTKEKLSKDAQWNYERLHDLLEVVLISDPDHVIDFEGAGLIVDAIFGTGLNRPIEGLGNAQIAQINASGIEIVSVDVPSGLYSDRLNDPHDTIVQSQLTITFQMPKLTFLLPENSSYIPEFKVVDIGLHAQCLKTIPSIWNYSDLAFIKTIYKKRKAESHKGTYGHALLVAGSYGMIGAAVLATQACVRAGAGKTTVHIPSCGYDILQNSVPEAMVWADYTKEAITTTYKEIKEFDAVGIGPGIGTHSKTKEALRYFLTERSLPSVLDADALNMIGADPELLTLISPNSILTPHPKEFDRLFGEHKNHLDRIQTAIAKAKELNLVIVLKNRYTAIVNSNGSVYFNSSGNSGLAKGGSGDVLTGIITALVAQKYDSIHAALLGVYIHGLAADMILERNIQCIETLKASDVCEFLHLAFSLLK